MEHQYYEFQCLTQGVTSSPHLFVRVTIPIMKYLCHWMVTIEIYIDDTLLITNSVNKMKRNVQLTLEMVEAVGFLINPDKSHLQPTTRLEFLGFIMDTKSYTILLSDQKCDNLKTLITYVLTNQNKVTICLLSKIIRKIVSTFSCCDKAPLHYRVLDRLKLKMFWCNNDKWSSKIILDHSCLQELCWWRINICMTLFTRSLHEVAITQHVFTDSSGTAFGGCWNEKTMQSKFSENQANLSINMKELLVIYYTLSALGSDLKNKVVLEHCYNSVSVSCIKKKGSSNAWHDRITQNFFHIADTNNFTLKITW